VIIIIIISPLPLGSVMFWLCVVESATRKNPQVLIQLVEPNGPFTGQAIWFHLYILLGSINTRFYCALLGMLSQVKIPTSKHCDNGVKYCEQNINCSRR